MDIHLIRFVSGCLLLAGASSLNEEMAELAKMVRDNCVDDVGVDVALLEQIDGGADLMPDDKLKCYIKCTMETAGMFGDGVVDIEAVIGLLPEDIKEKSVDSLRKCGTQKGTDDCDTAYKTQVCWQKANKADYIFI